MKLLKPAMIAAAAAMCMPLGFSGTAYAQDPYIGEIQQFGMNWCPRGWAKTDGQLLAINQNTALFSLLGTTYGGDGRTTFALPKYTADGTAGTAAPTSTPAPTSGEAKVFQHCARDGYGWSQSLGLGDFNEPGPRGKFQDNTVSAVKVSEGWEVELFDGKNYDGDSIVVSGTNECLVDEGFNDRTSSIRVRRKAATPAPVAATGPAVVTCIAMVGTYPSRN